MPVFRYLLLKLAARCNFNCTYCYWFRDESVYDRPPILTAEAESSLLEKLESHVVRHNLEYFSVLFHGGEPLLFGKRRFVALLDRLALIQQRTGCKIRLSITTNGSLIDNEWAHLFRYFNVNPTVSIDGPPEIHDRARIDRAGRPTHIRVIRGLNLLRKVGIEPGVLSE